MFTLDRGWARSNSAGVLKNTPAALPSLYMEATQKPQAAHGTPGKQGEAPMHPFGGGACDWPAPVDRALGAFKDMDLFRAGTRPPKTRTPHGDSTELPWGLHA